LMPGLQAATQALPDARSRLHYIARKTSDSANRVLNSVDDAKLEHQRISTDTLRLVEALSVATEDKDIRSQLHALVEHVQSSTHRIDEHLTNIMMAQDFHDLTGQIISKVVVLTDELEASLLKLLLQIAPDLPPAAPNSEILAGPVVDPTGRTDVVNDQDEVDDLLARMGF
ncbi:MAG: protein phosphatase CheZ, partial [Sphaerotilus sp.]|nr:protein phosphatase CheZ [Sphaerotilus sp.]